jgi:hypothetical protein
VQAFVLALLLSAGQPEGWAPLPAHDITTELVHCANRSGREWAIEVSGESIRPVPAPDERRQDELPFPISFLGAIPFDGDLPAEVHPIPGLAGDITPEERALRAQLYAGRLPAYAEWALRYGEKFARRYVVRLDGGWLIGFGGGEYGGSLWWYTAPGSGSRIAEGNIVDIIPVAHGREALVFGGLAHMGTDEGRVFQFTSSTGRPELRLVSDLQASPQAAIAEAENSVLVLTTQRLWRVAPQGAAESLCALDSLYLYPRSIAVLPSGDIWVGMRHLVARLRPDDSRACEVQWFAPSNCVSFVTHEEECSCRQ